LQEKKKRKLIIAIDGPAASGKSTTARLVAEKLGYLYIDTGAMYRALTLEIINQRIDINDADLVVGVAEKVEVILISGNKGPRTLLNGRDVSEEIRLPRIARVISKISAYKGVREIMKVKQRELARKGGVVMDGRDIGSVVLPDADVKIFMEASIDERTRRRAKELSDKKIDVDVERVREEIVQRDTIDATRDVAPLKPAKDASIVDTSNLSINDQVNKVMDIINALPR
jgi:cytidylate kinase